MGKQPQRLWGVTYIDRQTEVIPETIRRTRREAQMAVCDSPSSFPDWRDEWKDWHKSGCRAVRVNVLVAGNGGGDG